QRQGVTVGQAFALVLFIRLTHILWYLTGGFFVLRGGYGGGEESGIRSQESAKLMDTDSVASVPSPS
ncbi:MAG: hypothetical protein AAF656_07425, partial [Planctomycetota bacterium]